ncbi:hypothetical protein XNC1_1218 [Xenorhabdus nematophila ATCC 19061]|uniref:Uncharacterized protein n=1 Tax=Xenorhabdus nematophila (strain ATCC 19061 / DSM 3370 / CCUG 14189 / LMG 1036 / NCIMB 9965 / AN6) TaxID=406817 RepID=D3V9Q1_XENNA|nr:hypothetical protein XNC1_1218 [Xenorhabdus nematophila ATCC 19061]
MMNTKRQHALATHRKNHHNSPRLGCKLGYNHLPCRQQKSDSLPNTHFMIHQLLSRVQAHTSDIKIRD